MFKNQSNPRSSDDIIRNAQPTTISQERLLRDLSQLTHDHADAIPRLAELVYSRLEDNRAASVHECSERLRWNMRWRLANSLIPLLSRVLLYVYPDLNGKVQLVPVPLDEALGMRVSSKKLSGDYARRLEWCNGEPLEAPMPTVKKDVQSVQPAQGELFEVA